jgi:class 3 adenylate cyclase/tetratricopeptide (TPR) repeat protein
MIGSHAVLCTACETPNRDGARFCRGCGVALQTVCPQCGKTSDPESRFCDGCGAALDVRASAPRGGPASYTPKHLADRILTTRAALEGERRHVTVLFADVAGYTAIAERVDPEEMHAIMDRCFAAILAEVHRYEGTVNQFTGDGVMALFGAPVAIEDAPRRAASAALGIQRALEPIRHEMLATHGVEFRMRIGLNTGLVVVGKIGNDLRMDYTAVGDTTNLAARLQALARPGAVLVSEATHRQIAGFFDTRDFGAHEVRGKRAPVRAFEVLAERAVRGRVDALADVGLTPLVGRELELGLLRDAFESASAGQGQVVFLVGEAGIGKSRLLFEFRRGLAGQPHVWLEGRCASYGTGTAFLPLVDGLRRFFGIEDRDDEAHAAAKVDAGVASLGGDLGWAVPFLRLLLSLPAGDPVVDALDAASRRGETFRALKAITLQAAQQHPLVVVIEDLHWIDPASEEYLAFLADVVAGTRALLVCSHRPGYRHPFGDRSYHVRVSLRPLAPPDMATMTGALLGVTDVPSELRELIARKAEGNPFFVEEVAKSLLEAHAVRLEDGRAALAHDLADVSVPDSIQDVIMARIDRLPEAPRRAMQVASVIGREFALGLLQKLSEQGTHVQALVDELRGLELVYEKSAQPELAYMFKHALTHDVAYASILVQRRRTLHRMIGEAIEELYADRIAEHYEMLALHFERAEEWERAFDYHARAADKAMAAHATQAAAQHSRQGLAIADRLGAAVPDARRAALEDVLGRATFVLSEYQASAEAFERAAERSADPEARASYLSHAGMSFGWAHDPATAHRVLDDALALARRHGLGAAEALALANKGFAVGVYEGDLAADRRLLDEAMRVNAGPDSESTLGHLRFMEAMLAEWTGDYERAVTLATEVIATGRRFALFHLVIWPSWFRGKARACLGQYGDAIRDLREMVDLCERIGDRAWRTRLLNTLGWCYAEFGADERAQDFNTQAATLAREVNDPEIIANADINLAGNRLAAGDVDGARERLEPIYAGAGLFAHRFMRWRYTLHAADALGRVALARRDPERALALADEELAGAQRHDVHKVELRALELRARALLMAERPGDADTVLSRASVLADRIGYRRGQWVVLRLQADVARRAGHTADAAEYDARCRAIVERLAGAVPDADLRRALGVAAGR